MAQQYRVGQRIVRRFYKQSPLNYDIYRIREGGMGVVLLCLQQPRYADDFPGVVALKTLHDRHLHSASIRRQFLAEAEFWAQLQPHPNVVSAIETIEIESRPFVVLPWILGHQQYEETLRGWITGRAVDLKRCLDWSIQVCAGLCHVQEQYARRGRTFVHCDIKPENILVTQEEVARVTDFGLAQVGRTTDAHTTGDGGAVREADVYGTPEYMAPEQFDRSRPLDPRVDVYALGCVMYQTVGVAKPFEAPKTLHPSERLEYYRMRHVNSAVPPIRPAIDGCPRELVDIIERCLRKAPHERYGTVDELRSELIALRERLFGPRVAPTTVRPPTAGEWIQKGNSFVTLRRYAEALDCYEQAVQMEPEAEYAWWNKAVALWNLGRHAEVLPCLNRAAQFRRAVTRLKICESNTMEAGCLAALGRTDEAFELFDRVLALDPDYAVGWAEKGKALHDQERHEEALTCLRKAASLDRSSYIISTDLGRLLRDIGRLGDALSCFDNALRVDPGYIPAWRGMAMALGELGALQDAIRCCDRLLQLNPGDEFAGEMKATIERALESDGPARRG